MKIKYVIQREQDNSTTHERFLQQFRDAGSLDSLNSHRRNHILSLTMETGMKQEVVQIIRHLP